MAVLSVVRLTLAPLANQNIERPKSPSIERVRDLERKTTDGLALRIDEIGMRAFDKKTKDNLEEKI